MIAPSIDENCRFYLYPIQADDGVRHVCDGFFGSHMCSFVVISVVSVHVYICICS